MHHRLAHIALSLVAATAFAADDTRTLPEWVEKFANSGRLSAIVVRACPESENAYIVFDGRLYALVGDCYVDEDGGAWEPLVVTTTAYVPTREQCDEDPDVTATGTDAYHTHGVAADPHAIPYGTLLRIPRYGDAVVDDTGSAMRRDWSERGEIHLDLRIPFRRCDGSDRSDAECERVARAHGVQGNRIVLKRRPDQDLAEIVASR
jgi:3D (Asp-Asp-Asp) domain-containing protein